MSRIAGLLALVASLALCGNAASETLAVEQGGAWRIFWSPERSPARWSAADSSVKRALRWKRLAPGLEWASLRLACGAPAWRVRLIVARLDPAQLDLSLVMDLTAADLRPAWTIDRAPDDAVLAVNAGQFTGAMPWGWVTIDGVQRLRPGAGPLATSFAIDASGVVTWAHGDTLGTTSTIRAGFQSYPTLIAGDGLVPEALRTGAGGLSLSHRDARLALGRARDGRLLRVMTRFDALGAMAGSLPFGPTTPEMAAIMGALGACDAVMLDGGISAQLLLRGAQGGRAMYWPGLRKVPLALIARPRSPGFSKR